MTWALLTAPATRRHPLEIGPISGCAVDALAISVLLTAVFVVFVRV
jgi:hypothetical protein